MDDLCVYDVFNVCFATTNDSTVNWLQYRILHRILPVKYYLKKINIASSDSCTFCNENSETLQHVFVKCKKILPLWNALSARLYEKCSKRVEFYICNIIFGEYPLDGENKALNCIILFTKQYIFFCLKQNRVPVFLGLYNYLQLRYKIEKSAYLYKMENEKFEKIWSTWSGFFTTGSSMIHLNV